MMRRVLPRQLSPARTRSDFFYPLFDDVKKGESYLLRETPYFVYLYFVVFSVVRHLYLVFMFVCGHVFHFYFMT